MGRLMANVPASDILRSIAKTYRIRAVNDAPFGSVPFMGQSSAEDEEDPKARARQLSYETPASEWQSLPCQGDPTYPLRRFIDGSLFSRTVATFSVGGRRHPAVLACVGALALQLEGRRLVRSPNSLHVETVLSLLSNGIKHDDLLMLADGLKTLNVRLVTLETTEMTADIEVLRKRCWDLAKQQMEEAERSILLAQPNVPALVDGLLERRLTTVESHGIPAIGMVKRQMRQYLPSAHIGFLYNLKPCERTPAFIVETKHASIVSWYMRLSGDETHSPSYGVVRLTATQEYLERRFPRRAERWAEISAISHWIYTLRHREGSYPRVGISLEPIVRVEDELHALLPSIDQQVVRVHRALGL
jgi:hypothetical protein